MTQQKNMLVVDDEYAFGKSLKEYFERVGFGVAVATSGEQALDMIRENSFDLITLDIRMPGLNGYDVLEKLGAMENPPKVLVISAIDSHEAQERIMGLGAAAVFHKPVNLTDLILKIKLLLA